MDWCVLQNVEWAGGFLYVNTLILVLPWKLSSSASQIVNFALQILSQCIYFIQKVETGLSVMAERPRNVVLAGALGFWYTPCL